MFKAEIRIIWSKLRKGEGFIVYSHTGKAYCLVAQIINIYAMMDNGSKGREKEAKIEVGSGEIAFVELLPQNIFYVEKYIDCPKMGTIVLRNHNHTVALGKIISSQSISLL